MSTQKKICLVDAYEFIYRAYYAFIKNPRINSSGQNTSAVMGFINTLEEVLSKENPTHIGIAFDPVGKTFRHEAYSEYKAQRQSTPEDIKWAIPYIKKIISAYNIPILEIDGYEADDVIGTMAIKAAKAGFEVFMMTPDKDYAQLVNENIFMYRPKHSGGFELLGVKEIKEKYEIEHASQIIDMLGLMGDSSDNIPGCPGVGEKTAQKLIAEFGNIDCLLKNTDKLKGALKTKIETNTEKIIFSRFLATIKTDVPIDFEEEKLRRKKIDIQQLLPILDELEFKTLGKRLKDKYDLNEQNQSQLDLFKEDIADTKTDEKHKKTGLYQGELFFEDSHDIKNVNIMYYLSDLLNDKEEKLQNIFTNEIIAIEVFTDREDSVGAELLGISIAYKKNTAIYLPIHKENRNEYISKLKDLIENSKSKIISSNIKLLLIQLQHYNIEIANKLFDTAIAHYVLQPEQRHSTDFLAEVYLKYKTIDFNRIITNFENEIGKKKVKPEEIPVESIKDYMCEKADISLQLYDKLLQEIEKEGVMNLFENVEMPLTPVLATMEMNGMKLDTNALKETSESFKTRLNEIEQNIFKIANEKFNVSSPKQVGEILFDKLKITDKAKKTKTGQYVTSEEVLESYKGKHPIIEGILKYRGLKKLLSTYVDALPKLINKDTDKIHTSFNQTITATGRLSSSNPNLQNIPIRDEDGKEIRKAFIADNICDFFSADYSQIELRIMAHLSNDENMIHAFLTGEDIHAATAAKIYNVEIKEVTDEMRRKAKTANFGIIYGISVFGLAERLGISRQEAKELIEGYFNTYPGIKKYMDMCITRAKDNGFVETLQGRKRYLADINSRNNIVRGYAERNAINAPIQGSAADIIKVAMINIYKKIKEKGLKSKMILQVHDELNFSVPYDEKDVIQKMVVEEMENACKLNVPLKVEAGWGKNWLEAH